MYSSGLSKSKFFKDTKTKEKISLVKNELARENQLQGEVNENALLPCPLDSYLHLFVGKTIFRMNCQSTFFSTSNVRQDRGRTPHDRGMDVGNGTPRTSNTSESRNDFM